MEISTGNESLKISKKKKKAEPQVKEVIVESTSLGKEKKSKKKKSETPPNVVNVVNGTTSKKKRKRTEEPVFNGEAGENKKKKKEKLENGMTNGHTNGHTNGITNGVHFNGEMNGVSEKKKKKKNKELTNGITNGISNGIHSHSNGEMNGVSEKKKKKKNKEHGLTNGVAPVNGKHEDKPHKPKKHKAESDEEEPKSKQVFQEGSIPVQVTGFDGPLTPVTDFKKMNFHADLQKLVEGFTSPTLIQRYCFPALVLNRDVIGIAETGSGKTLAFSLPILTRLLNSGKSKSVKMLVVAPTRELALQTFDVVGKAVSAVCVYGGVSKSEQRQLLIKKKPIVIIGTPGRIVDFLSDDTLKLSEVEYFVLDEADRMLDLGFEPDIQKMAAKLPSSRQTIMFSATWPTSIRQMASRYLKNPITIMIGEARGEAKAAQTVQQIVEVIKDPNARDSRLVALLNQYHKKRENRVLVFVLYKKEAARVEQRLIRLGWSVGSIHGDKSQQDRTKALSKFKDGSCPLLIATDVAARGLDIPDVEYVINFTFPLTIEDYIHRIGRTGRAGKSGVAHTLFTDNDKAHAGELANVLRLAGLPVPEGLAAYGCAVKKKVHKEYGAFFKEVDPSVKSKKVKFDD